MSDLTTKEQAITATARDRELTDEYIESRIANVEFFVPNGYGGTLCHATLINGHIVRGESSCPDDENAQGLAYTDALNKIWELERHLAAERRYQAGVDKLAQAALSERPDRQALS
ncbi:MAG: Gp49 family protein [Gallionella sp.]|jgi:hypothetical protein